jgi:EmrB/QacA subfamily drug resistance transporter
MPGGSHDEVVIDDGGGGLRLASAQGRIVLLVTVLASGMAFLDATVVNVALPRLGEDLDASLAGLQWTVNGYTLSLAALILLGGSLGDRFGRRRVFVIGTVWFGVASVLCAVAPTVEVLILARVVQGVGGALLTPGSLAILQASFHPEERARAIGAWSGLSGVTTALGPFVGGWLVETGSWRWVFVINVPLVLLVVALSPRIPESRDPGAAQEFDVPGAVLGALALAGLTFALIQWPEDGASAAVISSAIGGLLAGLAFVVVERRSPHPMLPPSIFAIRQFTAVNVVTLCVYAALAGVFFFFVVQLQVVVGWSPTASGVATLPVTVLLLLLSSKAGALAQRIGPRLPLTVGPAVAAAGVLLLAAVDTGAGYLVDVFPGTVLLGLGLAVTVAPLTAAVLGAVEVERAGLASGVNNAVARTAGLIAVAALPLAAGLSGAEYQDPQAFSDGYRVAMLVCAGLLALGGLLGLLTVRNELQAAEGADPGVH